MSALVVLALAGCGATGAASEPSPDAAELMVIGDSWVTGGPMNSGPTWPFLLDLPEGWEVATDAVGGSGFIGDHPPVSGLGHGDRLDLVLDQPEPEVVIVAMGRNDVQHHPDEVVDVARADLEAIQQAWPDAELVVFSPFSPESPMPYTITLTEHLEGLAQSIDAGFVDVSAVIDGRERFFKDAHPNDAGHELIADVVESELTDLGVLS